MHQIIWQSTEVRGRGAEVRPPDMRAIDEIGSCWVVTVSDEVGSDWRKLLAKSALIATTVAPLLPRWQSLNSGRAARVGAGTACGRHLVKAGFGMRQGRGRCECS